MVVYAIIIASLASKVEASVTPVTPVMLVSPSCVGVFPVAMSLSLCCVDKSSEQRHAAF